VSGLLLERGQQRQQHLFERAGGQNLDFRGTGAARRTGGHEHDRKAQQRGSHRVLHDCRIL
jgi:hypothetical protein